MTAWQSIPGFIRVMIWISSIAMAAWLAVGMFAALVMIGSQL